MENDIIGTENNDNGQQLVHEMSEMEQNMRLQNAESNYEDAANEEQKIQDDLIFGKFKNMEEAEKGYAAAQRKIHEKQGKYIGAPKDGYSILTADDGSDSSLDTNNIGFQSFLKHCKENNLSQDGFDEYTGFMNDYIAEMKANEMNESNAANNEFIEDHARELGGWAAAEGLADQIGVGLQTIGLPETQVDALIGAIDSAEGMKALKAIVQELSYSDVPGSPGQPAIVDRNYLLERLKISPTLPMLEKDEYDKETRRLYSLANPD